MKPRKQSLRTEQHWFNEDITDAIFFSNLKENDSRQSPRADACVCIFGENQAKWVLG